MWWVVLLILTIPVLAVIAGAGLVWWVLNGIRLVASGALELDDEGKEDD